MRKLRTVMGCMFPVLLGALAVAGPMRLRAQQIVYEVETKGKANLVVYKNDIIILLPASGAPASYMFFGNDKLCNQKDGHDACTISGKVSGLLSFSCKDKGTGGITCDAVGILVNSAALPAGPRIFIYEVQPRPGKAYLIVFSNETITLQRPGGMPIGASIMRFGRTDICKEKDDISVCTITRDPPPGNYTFTCPPKEGYQCDDPGLQVRSTTSPTGVTWP